MPAGPILVADLARDLRGLLGDLPAGDKDFALSLVGWAEAKGSWTPKQEEAARKLIRVALTGGPAEEASPSVENLLDHFNFAKQSTTYPKLHVLLGNGDKLLFAMSGSKAKHPGTINITDGGAFGQNVWYGTITEKKGLWLVKDLSPETRSMLVDVVTALNKDVPGFAHKQLAASGTCIACGKHKDSKSKICSHFQGYK